MLFIAINGANDIFVHEQDYKQEFAKFKAYFVLFKVLTMARVTNSAS